MACREAMRVLVLVPPADAKSLFSSMFSSKFRSFSWQVDCPFSDILTVSFVEKSLRPPQRSSPRMHLRCPRNVLLYSKRNDILNFVEKVKQIPTLPTKRRQHMNNDHSRAILRVLCKRGP